MTDLFFLLVSAMILTPLSARAGFSQLPPPNPEQRISASGAIFQRDFSRPELCDPYTDPSGHLVWGDIEKRDGEPLKVNFAQARQICSQIGDRLPTAWEYQNFQHWAKGPGGSYNSAAFDSNGQLLAGTDVITNLKFDVWTQTESPSSTPDIITFTGSNGSFDSISRTETAYVRCVHAHPGFKKVARLQTYRQPEKYIAILAKEFKCL